MGRVDRSTVVDLYERCHAYVVPGEEDFGIAPVEAMAAGKPVIAFGSGGALETVTPGMTGDFFHEPTPGSLVQAIERVDNMHLDHTVIRKSAERFESRVFRERWQSLLASLGYETSELHS
jgi:glycosyltransferase involved in cell wall biosynthesis